MSIKAFLTSLNRLKSKMSVPVDAGDVRTQSGIRCEAVPLSRRRIVSAV